MVRSVRLKLPNTPWAKNFWAFSPSYTTCECSAFFTKQLELVGVGYRASNQGQKLDLALGFSHNIVLDVVSEVTVETVSEKGKNPIVKLSSFDKQLLGQVAAKIRGFRKPEPYKGKGVKFVGEELRRKAGKSA